MHSFITLLVCIGLTVFFVNYKWSQAVRILAFNEEEPKSEAVMAFVTMVLLTVAWSYYFSFVNTV